jgi:hypothetical protein
MRVSVENDFVYRNKLAGVIRNSTYRRRLFLLKSKKSVKNK